MAQHPNIPRGAYSTDIPGGPSYTLARRLSQTFHPILMNLASFLIVGFNALGTRAAGLGWALLCILTLLVPPIVFYYVRLRQGAYSDEDISVREQRNELYLFGLAWVLIASLGLALFGAPRPFLALMVSALGLGLVSGLINLFWKISAHASAVASAATIALLYWRPLGVLLGVCAIAVGWARVRTRNHTPMQVLAGFAAATSIIMLAFGILGLHG